MHNANPSPSQLVDMSTALFSQLDKTGTDTVVLQTVLGQFEAFLEVRDNCVCPFLSRWHVVGVNSHLVPFFCWMLPQAELRATRPSTSTDTRVHACVYMVSPTGREVKESDVLMMKAIHSRVNLVPVSDTHPLQKHIIAHASKAHSRVSRIAW